MEIGNEIIKAKYWKDMSEEFSNILGAICDTETGSYGWPKELIKRVNKFKKLLEETPRNGTL